MSTKAELKAKMTLDNRAFVRGMQSSMNLAKRLGGQMQALGTAGIKAGMMGLAGGFVAVSVAMAAALKNGLALGGKFNDLKNRLGSTAGKAALLTTAFEAGGLGADEVAGAIGRMQKALAGGSDSFAKMGLSADMLRTMDPTDALTQVGNAISKIKDPAARTAAAMELFGKSGAKLNQIFGDGGALELAQKSLGSMPALLDRFGGSIDDIGDKTGALKGKWDAFSVGITAGLIPVLNPLLDKMMSVDTAKFGLGLGQDIAAAFNGKDATAAIVDLSGRFIRGMGAAGLAAGEFLAAGMTNAFSGFIAEAQARVSVLAGMVQMLTGNAPKDLSPEEASRQQELGQKIPEAEKEFRGMKPDKRGKTVGGITFGDTDSYAMKRAELESMKREKAGLDERSEATRERGMSVEDRKASILAGGVRTGLGSGMTAEERAQSAMDRIKSSVGQELPYTARAMAAPSAPILSAGRMPVPAVPLQMPAATAFTTPAVGEPASGMPAPGSMAGAWNSSIRDSGSTLGPQGLKLGATMSSGMTKAFSSDTWRDNTKKPKESSVWKPKSSSGSSSKGGKGGNGAPDGNLTKTVEKILEMLS